MQVGQFHISKEGLEAANRRREEIYLKRQKEKIAMRDPNNRKGKRRKVKRTGADRRAVDINLPTHQ